MEGEFHFLVLWHTTNSEKTYGITWPCGPHHFKLGVSRIFSGWIWRSFKWHKIRFLHRHGTIDHLSSIHFSYTWLCNWEHPFSIWPEGKRPGALHVGQTLPWKATPIWCGTMWFLCALTMQLVDQPCTIFSSIVGSKMHHQKPQFAGFSRIGWLKLLPTSYKAKETSLVSCKHNRKTKRCSAHLYFLAKSTRLFKEMEHAWCIIML